MDERKGLVDANAVFFFQDQFIENSEDLLAVAVHTSEGIAEIFFVSARLQPFVQQRARDIDVPSEVVGRVTPQKEAVENRRFPLRGKRIRIFAAKHICNPLSPYRTTEVET